MPKSIAFSTVSWHLYSAQPIHRTVRFWLLDLQSFHQPAVLLRREQLHFALISRPLVNAAFQAFVQQDKAVLLPIQALDPIPAPSAEQKQRVGKRVKVKFLLYHSRKPVDPFSEICIPAGDVNAVGTGEVIQHGSTPYTAQ